MKVLSLFDGISCGMQALIKASIYPSLYIASEIDKYAIGVSKFNFPTIKHIGDVRNITLKKLNTDIDILIGGSPCTNLSISGKREGMVTDENIKITSLEQYLKYKKAGIIFKGESYLFWEYVRLFKELKPRYFFLENVYMKKEYMDIFTKEMGVEPVVLNSMLVSPQNRKRYYWTNIPLGEIENKNLILKDILEDHENKETFKMIPKEYTIPENKNRCLQVGYAPFKGNDSIKRVYSMDFKCPALTTMQGGHREPKVYIGNGLFRKITPLECERVQGMQDNFTKYGVINNKVKEISKSQRYKMCGNGWTVTSIYEFFKNI